MDNCLASNSETGGVGCDNMTMIVIALLQGKSKEEWYKMVGERVANGDGPCAPPEYGKSRTPAVLVKLGCANGQTAEFRGPGIHHHFSDDSPDDYEMDMDQRTRMLGGNRAGGGRIILLGDGTEIHTSGLHDEDGDVDMEDRGEAEELEEKDLAEQVKKGQTESKEPNGPERSQREETPAPASAEKVEEGKKGDAKSADRATPDESKMAAAVDGGDVKKAGEDVQKK